MGKQNKSQKLNMGLSGIWQRLPVGHARPSGQAKPVKKPWPDWWRTVAIVAGVVLVVLVLLAVWVGLDRRFYVQAYVVGAERVSVDQVLEASGLPGLHILWVRPKRIEAQLVEALPQYIESAQVACQYPGVCTVTVTERPPMMAWQDTTGQTWLIDDQGVISPAQGATTEGWVVHGPLVQDQEGVLDQDIVVALNALWESGEPVSSLRYVSGRGLTFVDQRGWRVIVGDGAGMAERLQILAWLAADLQSRGITPRFVDIRFVEAPYYSLTNDW